MDFKSSGYSPDVLIHLEVGEKKIRLADVLYDSATLFDKTEVAPHSKASLVFSFDGIEEREDIVLDQGISTQDSLIRFTYKDPERLNGRHFSV
jgi:hypothetical protein